MDWFGDSAEVENLKKRLSNFETDRVYQLAAQAQALKGDINAMRPEEGWFSGGGKRTKKRTKKRTTKRRTTKRRTTKRTRRRR